MLGTVIGEILSAVLDAAFPGPSTDRGRALLILGLGSAGLGLEIWAWVSVGDALRGPEWAFNRLMVGMLLGLSGFVHSAVALRGVNEHRTLTLATLLISGLAFFWPLWLIGQ